MTVDCTGVENLFKIPSFPDKVSRMITFINMTGTDYCRNGHHVASSATHHIICEGKMYFNVIDIITNLVL